jgi:hypothetical protein
MRVVKGKKGVKAEKRVPASPNQKIARITEYAPRAGIPAIGATFKDIYLSKVRNAVFHADYTLSDTEFHMIRDYYHSPHGYFTRDMPLSDLFTVIDRTFAFYYALLRRHQIARGEFKQLKNKAVPFDHRLKGLIEFIFEDDLICGFRVYWPNRQSAQFTRSAEGSHALNLWPQLEGGLSIDVGISATTPGAFSPLVEYGQEPAYTPASGRTTPPHWPRNLQPVPLE